MTTSHRTPFRTSRDSRIHTCIHAWWVGRNTLIYPATVNKTCTFQQQYYHLRSTMRLGVLYKSHIQTPQLHEQAAHRNTRVPPGSLTFLSIGVDWPIGGERSRSLCQSRNVNDKRHPQNHNVFHLENCDQIRKLDHNYFDQNRHQGEKPGACVKSKRN